MSRFTEMKNYIKEHDDVYLAYDSPYSDYIDELYGSALSSLSEKYEDLLVEPSIQCGRGGVFASFTHEEKQYSTNWDYEDECEAIDELAQECETEEEFMNALYAYIEGQLEFAHPEYDDEDEEADEEEEG